MRPSIHPSARLPATPFVAKRSSEYRVVAATCRYAARSVTRGPARGHLVGTVLGAVDVMNLGSVQGGMSARQRGSATPSTTPASAASDHGQLHLSDAVKIPTLVVEL